MNVIHKTFLQEMDLKKYYKDISVNPIYQEYNQGIL